ICSSVNRLFFMTSFSPLEAILSSFNWSENSRAGHSELDANSDTGSFPCQARQEVHDAVQINGAHAQPDVDRDAWQL
ncbi:hypothetical protein, partial [Burkholderia pseudomallei]